MVFKSLSICNATLAQMKFLLSWGESWCIFVVSLLKVSLYQMCKTKYKLQSKTI